MLSFSLSVFNNVEGRPVPKEESPCILVAMATSIASTWVWSAWSLEAGAAASIPARKASRAVLSSGAIGAGVEEGGICTLLGLQNLIVGFCRVAKEWRAGGRMLRANLLTRVPGVRGSRRFDKRLST